MIFSYNWLKNYIPSIPTPQDLEELLTMHSFQVEGVEKRGKDFLLNLDILPNRAQDCLSYWGLSREISAITGGKLKALKTQKISAKKGSLAALSLKISSANIASRYSALVIEGVKIKKSPEWLKKSLESVGIRSISDIVDLTNWIMLETGQPLHVFDYDKILGAKMTVRLSRAGEKVVTLDDKTHKLDDGIIVIEDAQRLIDLAGIMGGKYSEVDQNTKNIVLQAANFDRRSVYLAAKKLNHKTEASNIYGQGIDPNLTVSALQRAYFLLNRLGGGKICQIIDIYPKKVLPRKVKVEPAYISSLLGKKILAGEMVRILKSLGFGVVGTKKVLTVQIPTFRQDIQIREDVVEEVGRVYGYDKIKADFPMTALAPAKRNDNFFWQDIARNILKEAGFVETYNYSFFGDKEAKLFGYKEGDLVEIKNPTSAEYRFMRGTLIANLLKNISRNQDKRRDFKFFEVGKVFLKKGLAEKRMLAGVVSIIDDKKEAFFEAKGIVDSLLTRFGVVDAWYDEFEATSEDSKNKIWNHKKCAEIKFNKEEIGFLGEINPEVYQGLGIESKVIVFDLDFEKILKIADEEREYQPVSQFPEATRDIAVLVPSEVRIDEVLNIMEITGGELVTDIDLFDIYEDEKLEGRKSLAFHIIYQAQDRTLKSEEINIIQDKITKALEENPGWEVRR